MQAYPGVWELPLVMWNDLKEGRCSMADACSNPPTAEVGHTVTEQTIIPSLYCRVCTT